MPNPLALRVGTIYSRAYEGVPLGAPRRHARKNQSLFHRLLSVPGIAGAAAVTALVSWAVTTLASSVTGPSNPDPLALAVETNPGKISEFADFPAVGILPTGRVPQTHPTGCDSFTPWLHSRSGVDAGVTRLQVVAQGMSSTPVLLSDLRVRVVRRAPPIIGAEVVCPSAGRATFREIAINLDTSPPKVVVEHTQPFGFTLAAGQTEPLDVTAEVHDRAISWTLLLDVVIGGRRETRVITDRGRPFITTPLQHTAAWTWGGDAWSHTAALPGNV
jgi:hypothetical protein